MILGNSESEIVTLAVENQSEHFDGVVQYNYETGKLFGCSMSQNETENPANPFLEVYRIHQGVNPIIYINHEECDGCDYYELCKQNGTSEDDMRSSERCIECCIDAFVDNEFDDTFQDYFYEGVERQVRDIIHDYLFDTVDKLDDIRIALSDKVTPYNYMNVRQEKWVENVIDNYVDMAMDDGFTTTETTPLGYVDSEVEHIATAMEFDDDPEIRKCANLVRNGKFEEVLALLQ